MKRIKQASLPFFILFTFTWTGCVMVDLQSMFSSELEEVVLFEDEKGHARDKILLIDLNGLITTERSSGLFSKASATPDYIKAVLNKAKADEKIKAILLRVNSPGGGVSATDMIAYELREFAKANKLPLYAHIMSVGASGGYYTAVVADRIYAEPTAITGSIGVILVLPKLKGLAEKIGYEQVVIKSGDMKDLGNMFRDMKDSEQEVFQSMVMSMYDRFLDTIVENREAFPSRKELKPIADGRVYTAGQAKANGLIDEVAHLDKTLSDLKKKANIKKADVVTFSYRSNPEATLYSSAQTAIRSPVHINLPTPFSGSKAGFYYLWQVGE